MTKESLLEKMGLANTLMKENNIEACVSLQELGDKYVIVIAENKEGTPQRVELDSLEKAILYVEQIIQVMNNLKMIRRGKII